MRIPSGTTDQYIYFVAVDSTDLSTRETGLTTFTVYRSRDGGAAAAMTTPTINETDTTNMPGVYELLLDEDMTIAAGNTEEEMVFHITQASMAPVTRSVTLFRPTITEGQTLAVTSSNIDALNANTITNSSIAASAITPTEASVDVSQISGDTAAADNLEAAFDGTGYAGGTILQDVNIASISGDTTAADNLEAAHDGTTLQDVNATQISGSGPAADNAELFFNGTGYAGGTTALNVNVASMDTDSISAAALSAAAATKITDDIFAEVIESQGSITAQQSLSIILSVLAGATTSSGNTFLSPDGVATRVAATTNASNERTTMTLTPSS